MSDLSAKKCVACEGGVDPLTPEQTQSLLKQLHADWRVAADGKSIHREWKFRNFFHTMSFVNAVAHIANSEDHHPDMEVSYGQCRIKLTTHAIDGLSENDFIVAAKIDQLPKT
jgi:4a-hydroxytetrahydrobiopterin dehydratase